MNSAERENYRAKAQQAEDMAVRFAEGSFERESWLMIAKGYRDLLDSAEKRSGASDGPEP